MSTWDAADLADLRWHYHGAYVINGGDNVWVATRTDNGRSLFADTAEALLTKIRLDYAAKPVPRPEPARPDVVKLARKLGG
jgi:hypothetical protein